MRTIQRQISLEKLVSRLPGVWPAYLGETLYYFSNDKLKERQYTHSCNYGMFPCNVIIDKVPSSAYTCNEYHVGDCNGFVLSWESISQWYHFFTEYYHLLNDYGHCNRTYYSAEDYYNYEHGILYQGQMKYGTDKETYIELDKLFYARGGRPNIYCQNSGGTDLQILTIEDAKELARNGNLSQLYDVVWAEDDGFYKWLCENVIPTFSIPNEYRDYWNKKKLFYPDVVNWLGWFYKRDSYTTLNDCNNTEDCCDCQEYFNRGGKDMYNKLRNWYQDVNARIIDDLPTNDGQCFGPMIYSHVYLQGSLENLGMEDNLSEEYQVGIDYRVANGLTATANTKGGTVISMSGDSLILQDGKSGFDFDNCLMEKYYDKTAFNDYTGEYIADYPNDFVVSSAKFYTFTEENVKLISTASTVAEATNDFNEQYAAKNTYTITVSNNGWILINGILYPIEKTEYGSMNGKNLFVYREDYTDAPYTMLNGRKIYAKLDLSPDEPKYYFTFFDVLDGDEVIILNGREYKAFPIRFDENSSNLLSFITYNGNVYEVTDNGANVDGMPYTNIVSGYIDTANDTYFVLKNNANHAFYLTNGSTLIENQNTRIDNGSVVFEHEGEWEIYSVEELTGTTVSKIYDLRAINLLVDDIGNTIQGVYSLQENHNHQPPQGEEIEPMYQVGNVANIRAFSKTVLNANDIQNGINYFCGDIITEMLFYYMTYDNEMSLSTAFTVRLEYNEDGSTIVNIYNPEGTLVGTPNNSLTSLQAIRLSTAEMNRLSEGGELFHEHIYCNVTYYCGATLARKTGDLFYNLADGYNYGIQYTETVNFRKIKQEYYLKKPQVNVLPTMQANVSAHSVSYPICCYELSQEMTTITSSTYNTTYEAALANFKTKMCLYKNVNDCTFISDDMAKRNNMEVFPTYREEYKIGVACPPSIDSTVDVDRGINAAFERHIKLGEVTSLEALELYGNGYFAMMTS